MPDPAATRTMSEETKNFFSAGTTFSFVGSAGAVQIVWSVLVRLNAFFKPEAWCLVLSILIVLAYAFVIPEPQGYDNAGKLRLTAAEGVFGLLNSFIVCGVVLGLNEVAHAMVVPK